MTSAQSSQPTTTRAVVITGGGQGIGRAFAHGFANAGYRVVIGDQNMQTASTVVGEVQASGGVATAIETDVSDRASCVRLAEHAVREFGRIDVLINNAVVKASGRSNFWEIDEAEWDRLMTVNVKGVWLMMCSVLPTMRDQGSGVMINMSSAVFNAGTDRFLHYAASKAAIVGITRSSARELGPFNIRVNCIMPGYVATEVGRTSSVPDTSRPDDRVKDQIIKRSANPEDVLGIALFLASDQSRFMTGQSVNIDGGRTFI